MSNLLIQAGPSALAHIKKEGLAADDVAAIFGAAGAAKWLTIAGLDRAVFADFMKTRTKKTVIDLFGTSVGAFKLAAAARANAGRGLDIMAEACVMQTYAEGFSPQVIHGQLEKITLKVLGGKKGMAEILANPRYHLHIGVARCHGILNSTARGTQALAMSIAALRSIWTAKHLRGFAERAVFSDPRSKLVFTARDGFPVLHKKLTAERMPTALLASGTVPFYVQGLRFADDPRHVHHDGGLLDYHPAPGAFWPPTDGLVLYPHFYDHCKLRWFDQFFKWRRIGKNWLDKVVLVSPTPDFIASLPNGKIPSRHDFYTYRHDEASRFEKWHEVVARSHELGAEFVAACASGEIAARVTPL